MGGGLRGFDAKVLREAAHSECRCGSCALAVCLEEALVGSCDVGICKSRVCVEVSKSTGVRRVDVERGISRF
jgi:hypothetical protein